MMCSNKIAAVTGASGMIGKRVVERLLNIGCHVRVLSRKSTYKIQDIEQFIGELEDEKVLQAFTRRSDFLFHCAGELHDEKRMKEVNVRGSERLLSIAQSERVKYICYISSAGVVGRSNKAIIDETTICLPGNMYERSKYAAEKIFESCHEDIRIVILRPTNVVDDSRPGILKVITEPSLKNRIKMFIIGEELSHVIHAENVAAAAIHFIDKAIETPECFFISCDHEPGGKFSELKSAFLKMSKGKSDLGFSTSIHLPKSAPYLLRKLIGRGGNKGDIRYSSKKLLASGFIYPVTLTETINRIAVAWLNRKQEQSAREFH